MLEQGGVLPVRTCNCAPRACALRDDQPRRVLAAVMGILLFSGSLYLLALTNPVGSVQLLPWRFVFPCRLGVVSSCTAEVESSQPAAAVLSCPY